MGIDANVWCPGYNSCGEPPVPSAATGAAKFLELSSTSASLASKESCEILELSSTSASLASSD